MEAKPVSVWELLPPPVKMVSAAAAAAAALQSGLRPVKPNSVYERPLTASSDAEMK